MDKLYYFLILQNLFWLLLLTRNHMEKAQHVHDRTWDSCQLRYVSSVEISRVPNCAQCCFSTCTRKIMPFCPLSLGFQHYRRRGWTGAELKACQWMAPQSTGSWELLSLCTASAAFLITVLFSLVLWESHQHH